MKSGHYVPWQPEDCVPRSVSVSVYWGVGCLSVCTGEGGVCQCVLGRGVSVGVYWEWGKHQDLRMVYGALLFVLIQLKAMAVFIVNFNIICPMY